jgi:hypothetical protein
MVLVSSNFMFSQTEPFPESLRNYESANPGKSYAYNPETGEILSYESLSQTNTSDGVKLALYEAMPVANVSPLEVGVPCGGFPFGFTAICWPGRANNVTHPSGGTGAYIIECIADNKICFMTNVVWDPSLSWWW